MPSYGDLFLMEYCGITEANFFKGMKELFSEDARQAQKHVEAADKADRKKDYKTAAKECREANKYLKKVLVNAKKIPDDSPWENIVRLIFTPSVVYFIQIGNSDFEFTTFTRSSTVNYINKAINYLDKKAKDFDKLARR